MIAAVSMANRTSDMSPFLGAAMVGRRGGDDVADGAGEARRCGRQFMTASTEARQGWIWSGYENMTRTTMAARPIVDAAAGGSGETFSPILLYMNNLTTYTC
jgi:hypothetical protein